VHGRASDGGATRRRGDEATGRRDDGGLEAGRQHSSESGGAAGTETQWVCVGGGRWVGELLLLWS
jgi:hypothetical protein